MRRLKRFLAMLLLVSFVTNLFYVLPVMAQSSNRTGATNKDTDVVVFEGTDKLIQDIIDNKIQQNAQPAVLEIEDVPDTKVMAPMSRAVAAEAGDGTVEEIPSGPTDGNTPAPSIDETDFQNPSDPGSPGEVPESEDQHQHVIAEPTFTWDRQVVTWIDFCTASDEDAWTIDADGYVLHNGTQYKDPVMQYPVRVQSLAFDPLAEGGPFILAETIKEYRYSAKVSGTCASCDEEVAPFDAYVTSKVLIGATDEETKAIMEEYIGQELYAAAIAPRPDGQLSFAAQMAFDAYAEDNNPENTAELQEYIQDFMTDPDKMGMAVGDYAKSLEGKMLIKELQNAYGSTIYTAMYSPNPEAGEQAHRFIANMDATKALCLDTRDKMYAFNAAFPQYFGAVTPYWTNKTKSEHGFGEMDVIKGLFNMNDKDVLPYFYLEPAISAVGQGFISYVMRFGPAMEAMIADAMEVVDPRMTDIQKALVLHDWMAKYASFDMQSLVDMAAGTGTGDPISMTAFGTLLHDTLGINLQYDQGGVCLGYAAAYVLLLQTANLKANVGNAPSFDYFIENPVADFVGIQFLVDIEESSVASGDSGFGNDGAMFNSPHFFNAVKAKDADGVDQWYIVDASYNDVHTETLSQQRVETDGSISHGYFMVSPLTIEEMFDGKFQYMDSLYDGSVWVKQYADQGNPEAGYMYTVGNIKDEETDKPELFTYQEAESAAQEKFPDMSKEEQLSQIFLYYEQIMLDDDLEGYDEQEDYSDQKYAMAEDHLTNLAEVDTAYNDIDYENAWFAYVTSEISFNPVSGYFYYVSNPNASYASMMRMMKQMGDDFGDMLDGMDMNAQKNEPKNADQLRKRPAGAEDLPEEDESGSGSMPGMPDMSGFTQPKDSHATTVFHYGYGTIGAQAQEQRERDEEAGFDFGGMGGNNTPVEVADEDKGPFYDECLESKEFRNMYPDLAHTLFFNDGKIYFNVGRKIFTMSQPDGSQPDGEILQNSIKQFKEYNDVTYGQNENRFIGMSFHTDAGDDFTLRYHPIGAICLKNQMKWEVGEDGVQFRRLEPTIFVSIGTNFSNSYKDEDGNTYTKEALNYNPDYNKFMDDGSDPDVNTNDEFMWCANVVDKMVLETALNDTQMVDVTVDPWCGFNEFTEKRSAIYGLSDGSTKVEKEGTALYHLYEWNEEEGVYICKRCLHAISDFLPGDVNGDGKVNSTDVMMQRKFISNPNTVEIDKSAADMNGDGKVNSTDVMLLRKQIANS